MYDGLDQDLPGAAPKVSKKLKPGLKRLLPSKPKLAPNKPKVARTSMGASPQMSSSSSSTSSKTTSSSPAPSPAPSLLSPPAPPALNDPDPSEIATSPASSNASDSSDSDSSPSLYDPAVPNDYLAHLESIKQKAKLKKMLAMNETVKRERAALALEQASLKTTLQSKGDFNGVLQLQQRQQEQRLAQGGGRGRGRGLSNVPAWLAKQNAEKLPLSGGNPSGGFCLLLSNLSAPLLPSQPVDPELLQDVVSEVTASYGPPLASKLSRDSSGNIGVYLSFAGKEAEERCLRGMSGRNFDGNTVELRRCTGREMEEAEGA